MGVPVGSVPGILGPSQKLDFWPSQVDGMELEQKLGRTFQQDEDLNPAKVEIFSREWNHGGGMKIHPHQKFFCRNQSISVETNEVISSMIAALYQTRPEIEGTVPCICPDTWSETSAVTRKNHDDVSPENPRVCLSLEIRSAYLPKLCWFDLEVSQNRGTPSHHPFIDGLFFSF